MVNPITPALIALKRSAVESIYTDLVTVSVIGWTPEDYSGIKREEWTDIAVDVPCRVVAQTVETLQEKPKQFRRMIGLDLNPELVIPPGARLRVTHQGRVDDYRLTSLPQVYTSHQRVDAERYGESELWA